MNVMNVTEDNFNTTDPVLREFVHTCSFIVFRIKIYEAKFAEGNYVKRLS